MNRVAVIVVVFLTIVSSVMTLAARETESVSLDAKVGQLFMIGFRGLEVEDDFQIVRDIASGRVGGVILFDYDVALDSPVRNIKSPEQVRELVYTLKEYTQIPLFVA
ncbi:glycoside hydrolase family 3, partial [Candidatus Bipolaricaulota bacterium]|nr:glycoside hydrolase family 3 [Candidatus Bipolaricaulota bacterium]